MFQGLLHLAAAMCMVMTTALLATVMPAAPASATQESWTPSGAPMPTVLPNGNAPESMHLSSTSCSSAAFCVAVGSVSDSNGGGNIFPVAETYSQGSWSVSVLPMPSNASTGDYTGVLMSVSCPSDGVCAAVGLYDVFDPSLDGNNQIGLLETLSNGVWTPSEGTLPNGATYESAGLNSVSCSDQADCVAVGNIDDAEGDAGLIYTWSAGSWSLQIAPIPSGFDNSIALSSVSCPDTASCVVAGSYEDETGDAMYGLILTLASGTWTAIQAPMPADSTPWAALIAVDCPDVGSCVAGGHYEDTNSSIQPVLLQLEGGSWTATEAPLPSDSATNPNSSISGVYCPADGACIATGSYWADEAPDDVLGMILTQSGGAWTAQSAPLPSDESNSAQAMNASVQMAKNDAVADSITSDVASSSTASLAGVGCGTDAFCAAAGTENVDGLLETTSVPNIPSVTGVSPITGPATGGTNVTVTGTNFTPTSTVSFGGGPATTTTYVSASELQATAPPSCAGAVDVTVTSNGLTSRANNQDLFSSTGNSCPVVTGVSPNVGEPTGGTPVTITGTNLGGATEVDFGPSNPAQITSDSDDEISVLSPGGNGTVAVTVTTGSGTSIGNTPSDQYGYSCDPAVFLSADSATALAKSPFSFTVTTCSTSVPVIKGVGLPPGLRLVNHVDGTATISGTPGAKDTGTYAASITARVTNQTTATQTLLITVDNTPVFESKVKDLVHTGTAFSYPVTTVLGYPVPTITTTSTLPGGVTLTDNHNGTAILGGTPDPNTGGTYPITIGATNGIGAAVNQSFLLTVYQAPVIAPIATANITTKVAMTPLPITATGYPEPKLRASGLPKGITLTSGSIEGTTSVAAGAYTVEITASSKAGSTAQTFTLVVNS
jgi:IPT/TIG domain/Putative Ig domain